MKVIDSSAMVAAVLREPGGDLAQADVNFGIMSLINVAETVSVLVRKGYTHVEAVRSLEESNLKFHIPNKADAYEAARLGQIPGLSLGDSFCIALAKSLKTPAVTADRLWAELNLDVAVELIR
jgi:ribonuclease VapC